MSATMRHEWASEVDERASAIEVEIFGVVATPGVASDDREAPQREHRRALIRKIFHDYAPALRELANR